MRLSELHHDTKSSSSEPSSPELQTSSSEPLGGPVHSDTRHHTTNCSGFSSNNSSDHVTYPFSILILNNERGLTETTIPQGNQQTGSNLCNSSVFSKESRCLGGAHLPSPKTGPSVQSREAVSLEAAIGKLEVSGWIRRTICF